MLDYQPGTTQFVVLLANHGDVKTVRFSVSKQKSIDCMWSFMVSLCSCTNSGSLLGTQSAAQTKLDYGVTQE